MLNRLPEAPVNGFEYFPRFCDLLRTGAGQTDFHERAAATAREQFGQKVFVRAVVEVSNFCRQNCSYCGMRRENRGLGRYRADVKQIAELLIQHRPASVTDVNLQAGEDPAGVREIALPLINTLRRETNLGISVCLGSLNPALYDQLQDAGASVYIIKFETGDAAQYRKREAPGTLEKRLANIRLLAANGWNVSSGFIAGLPEQTEKEIISNFRVAAELPLAGCSVSPFIPGDETPLAKAAPADIELTLNCMAALRLMRPDWVMPAVSALNIAQPGSGYRRGLRAGANLVTINMTPKEIRGDYVLYKRDRFIMTEERILSAITAEGLVPSQMSLTEHYRRKREAVPITTAAR